MSEATNRTASENFLRIFAERNSSLLESFVAETCVMQTVFPDPDGATISGRLENIEFWRQMVIDERGWFELEEIDLVGDRGINRWRYHFHDGGSVRGVTVFKFAGGKIIEALAYAPGFIDAWQHRQLTTRVFRSLAEVNRSR